MLLRQSVASADVRADITEVDCCVDQRPPDVPLLAEVHRGPAWYFFLQDTLFKRHYLFLKKEIAESLSAHQWSHWQENHMASKLQRISTLVRWNLTAVGVFVFPQTAQSLNRYRYRSVKYVRRMNDDSWHFYWLQMNPSRITKQSGT